MGRLAVMIGGIEADKTPLERRLEKFGGQIARAVLALAILIAVGGLLVDGLERIRACFRRRPGRRSRARRSACSVDADAGAGRRADGKKKRCCASPERR